MYMYVCVCVYIYIFIIIIIHTCILGLIFFFIYIYISFYFKTFKTVRFYPGLKKSILGDKLHLMHLQLMQFLYCN